MRAAVFFLGTALSACATATLPTTPEPSAMEKAHQQFITELSQQNEQLFKLHEPYAACVKKNASELSSSSESADVAARVAVARCSKESAAYRSAIFRWKAMGSHAEAVSYAEQSDKRIADMALSIIVSERQRRRSLPQQPAPKPVPSTRAI